VWGEINRPKDAQRRCSTNRGEGGSGGSKSDVDNSSPVANGRQEVEGAKGRCIRGRGAFTRRREMVKRGLGRHFLKGGQQCGAVGEGQGRSEAAPRGEEVGEGSGPTDSRSAIAWPRHSWATHGWR
jgi:hypothetical protein